jgi:hypothetical protein
MPAGLQRYTENQHQQPSRARTPSSREFSSNDKLLSRSNNAHISNNRGSGSGGREEETRNTATHTGKSATAVFSLTRAMHHPAEFVSKLIVNLSASVTLQRCTAVFNNDDVEREYRAYACVVDASVSSILWTCVWTSLAAVIFIGITIAADPHLYPVWVLPPPYEKYQFNYRPKDGDLSPVYGLICFAISTVIFLVTAIVTSRYVNATSKVFQQYDRHNSGNVTVSMLKYARARDSIKSTILPWNFFFLQSLALGLGFTVGIIGSIVTGPYTIVTTNKVGILSNYIAAIIVIARWQPWLIKIVMLIGSIAIPASLFVFIIPSPTFGTLTPVSAVTGVWIYSLLVLPFLYFIGLDARLEYAVIRVVEHVREASKERANLTRRLTRGLVPEHLIEDVIQRFHDADELEADSFIKHQRQEKPNPPPPLFKLRRPLQFYTQQQHGSFWQRCAIQPVQNMTTTYGELCVVAMRFEPFEADAGRALLRLRGGLSIFDENFFDLSPSVMSSNRRSESATQVFDDTMTSRSGDNPLAGHSHRSSSTPSQVGDSNVNLLCPSPASSLKPHQESSDGLGEIVPADAEAVLSVLDEVDAAIASVSRAYLRVVSVIGDNLMIAGPIGEPKNLETSDDEVTTNTNSNSMRSKEVENHRRRLEKEKLLDDDQREVESEPRVNVLNRQQQNDAAPAGDPDEKRKETRRIRETFVMRAALGIVEVLRHLSSSGGRTFTASVVVDSAIAAVIGDVTTALRYSIFGVAPRSAQRLLQAAPPVHPSGTNHRSCPPLKPNSVALALESFRRLHDRKLIARETDQVLDRIAPDFRSIQFGRMPTAGLDEPAFDWTVFNKPMRWRIDSLGQVSVYPLKLTSDSVANSGASSPSNNDDLDSPSETQQADMQSGGTPHSMAQGRVPLSPGSQVGVLHPPGEEEAHAARSFSNPFHNQHDERDDELSGSQQLDEPTANSPAFAPPDNNFDRT